MFGFEAFLLLVKILRAGVVKLWPRSGRWGINLETTFCPICGNELPPIRKPVNRRQILWGGWTRNSCGSELDKYGQLAEPGADA